jgi:anti-anti-sigma factor
VPLSFETRRVGDITVVTCRGRIVEGAETVALQQHVDDLLPFGPHIVLNLADVDFLDSSGLGLLTRYFIRMRNARGGLKLCAVSPKIAEVLRVTHLHKVFEPYASEGDAIDAFYERTDSAGASFRFHADILCVEPSADVQAYIRELLIQAGYGVQTAGNLPDALILLQATRPKVLVINADLRAARQTQTATKFNRLADHVAVVELPADFSTHDAGEAGRQLLDRVHAVIESSRSPSNAAS